MKKVTKILIIISIIIIALGIVAGMGVSSELLSRVDSTNNLDVDGTDFTAVFKLFATMGSSLIGFIIVLYALIAVCAIWIVYGIIILIIKIVNKVKKDKNKSIS